VETAENAPPSGPIEVDGAKAAEVLASDAEIVIIDIRTPEEFAEGHLAGAINLDFMGDDFEAKLAALDREKPFLMHCASGGRSGRSLPVFEKLGFERLYHLNTGFNGWVADGQPVEK
jgi:rhodanese-related sulfurtransferase